MKYQKKQIIIDAIQYQNNISEIEEYFPNLDFNFTELDTPVIQTLEGDHYVSLNDWIIKGIAGEYYPCKPDIFAATYKLINNDFKTVSVQYPRSLTNYTFMTEYDCKVGDKAVVFTNGNWNVVKIVEIHDEPQLDGNYNYTWLVQIVDRTEYDRLVIENHEGHPNVGNRL